MKSTIFVPCGARLVNFGKQFAQATRAERVWKYNNFASLGAFLVAQVPSAAQSPSPAPKFNSGHHQRNLCSWKIASSNAVCSGRPARSKFVCDFIEIALEGRQTLY